MLVGLEGGRLSYARRGRPSGSRCHSPRGVSVLSRLLRRVNALAGMRSAALRLQAVEAAEPEGEGWTATAYGESGREHARAIAGRLHGLVVR
jgi:hypothetical protein